MDYQPLFESGFHDIPFLDLEESMKELLVRPFAGSRRRELLLQSLLMLLRKVKNLGILTEAWIDGSFVTDKFEPNDIDIVFWYDDVTSVSPRELRIYRELKDADLMEFRYHCDVYLARNSDDSARRFWKNWFGKSRTGDPKGIVRIFLLRGGCHE